MAADLRGHPPTQVLAAIQRISSAWWSDPERHRTGRLDLAGTRRQNVGEALKSLAIEDDDLTGRIVEDFERRRFAGLRLFPGARQTLDHFHAADVSMALVTNGDSIGQRAKIERFDLARYFACILIEEEFGVGKPDPRVFQHALDELGVSAQEAWMVGDRPEWEILPAQRLGLRAIWVDIAGQGMKPGVEIEPDRVIRSIIELVE